MMKWTKKGFSDFAKGKLGNGGQNLYISANGILQRIFQYDLNADGYPELPVTNAHSMNECPPLYVFNSVNDEQPLALPTQGAFDALLTDLYDRGVEDLVVACQHNGVHSDVSALIYFGSEEGLSEKYKTELRVPNSIGVAAGRFDGGKKALAFLSGKKTRIFYQTDKGIEASCYKELNIAAVSVAAGDLDGDGFDDLFVILQGTGEVAVYWGGEDGIREDRVTVFGKPAPFDDSRSTSTTEGRKMFRWLTWRCSIVRYFDKPVTFRVEGNDAVFESFNSSRKPQEELRVSCKEPVHPKVQRDAFFFGFGPVFAAGGDLRSDGSSDIVIAVATGFDEIDDSIILWEKENYSFEKSGKIPLRCPKTLQIAPFGPDGRNRLLVGQSCRFEEFDVEAEVYRFHSDGSFEKEATFPASEPTRVLAGPTYLDSRNQLVIINHEGETKLGLEDVWIYLGGPDGYDSKRRLSFPGHSAVDTIMADFNDDGYPDVLIVNSAENAGYLSPGSTIYWGDAQGFDTNRKTDFPAGVLSHGAAIGDFRNNGYLDIIIGGIHSRELKIFEGGPEGYDTEHPRVIVMGPEKEVFKAKFGHKPQTYDIQSEKVKDMTPEIRADYAEVRWLFAADFNSDGFLDVFVSQIRGHRSLIYWGGPEGISEDRYQELATDGVASANVADLNGNGYPDLILACHQSLRHTIPNEKGKIVIYWGGPDGYQEFRKTELPSPCCNAVTIQDFNRDGLLDIYGTAYSNGRCRDIDSRMYYQTPDRVFHIDHFQNIFNHSGCGCMAGDFNGNGYIDLAVASHKEYGHHVTGSYVFWGGPDGINEQRFTELPGRGAHGMCSVDIGNIMDRSDKEYYYSETYEIPAGMTPLKVSWRAENGPATWVKMQIRSADTPELIAREKWSEPFENESSLEDFKRGRLVQYRLELGARCGCGTPRVSEVTIEFGEDPYENHR